MLNKFLATSVATAVLGTGIAGIASHDAEAAENYSDAELAQMAQSGSQVLNQAPIEAGDYDYNFTIDGYSYSFTNEGGNFSWSYDFAGGSDNTTADSSDVVSTPLNDSNQVVNKEVETPNVSAPVKTSQPVAQKAPVKTSAPKAETKSSGGVNSHLELIKQRESGGDYSAINASSGAAGAYQFMQGTWDSVAPSEWKGKSPASAPKAVQDAAAQKLYDTEGSHHWVTA